ncbi:MAG: hypothetical protein WAK26_00970, partial [Terracidiphilus sp.]
HPPTLRFKILAGHGCSLAGSVWIAPKPLHPRRGLCRSSSALIGTAGVVDSSGVFKFFSIVFDPIRKMFGWNFSIGCACPYSHLASH